MSITAQAAGPDAGDGPGSVTLAISWVTSMLIMLISSQARLRGPTLATCQLGEVASTPPMQKGAASESPPRNAHVVQGLGHSARASSRICSRTAQRLSRFLQHMICTPR